eukprot:962925-Prymnesium_polylepis.1
MAASPTASFPDRAASSSKAARRVMPWPICRSACRAVRQGDQPPCGSYPSGRAHRAARARAQRAGCRTRCVPPRTGNA